MAFAMLISFPLTNFGQKYIWDKDHKCQIFSNTDADIRTFTYKDGVCKNGLLNGNATVELFEDGKLYYTIKATFKDGYATGNAEQVYADGVTFKGTVEKNYWKYGVYTIPEVYVYTGGFSENKKHGHGKIVYDDGRVFECNFNMDVADYTQGKWFFKDGSKFIAIKELSTNKEVVGWFNYPPGTKETRLQYEDGRTGVETIKVNPDVPVKRYMPVGRGKYKVFDYNNEGPDLETADTFDKNKTPGNIPTLDNLQAWLNMSYANFDTEVKKFGFKFREKEDEEEAISYYYTRSVNDDDNDVIHFLVEKKDKKRKGIEMLLQVNFFKSYLGSINEKKYVEESCSSIELIGIDVKECKEFKNSNYMVMLKQWRDLSDKKDNKTPYTYELKILTR